MKKAIILLVSIATTLISMAQCDKRIIYKASKAEILDSQGIVRQTIDDSISLEVDKKEMTLKRGDNDDNTLEGSVGDWSCDWKDVNKNGKTTFKASLTEKRGDVKDVTVTISAIEGKFFALVAFAGVNLKIYIDEAFVNS